MDIRNVSLTVFYILILLSTGCSKEDSTQSTLPAVRADTIYAGGNIITINDEQPSAEAVAVKDGRIIAVGKKDEVMKTAGKNTRQVDLAGKTMLPGFVDAHGHAYAIGIQASTANLLPAPDGSGNSVAAIQKLLEDWASNNKAVVERVGWIAGFGYDDSQLDEKRHPTRDDLDKVSTDIPIIIVHQSGHLGVANSKALEIAGVTSETKNPKGGAYRRKPNSNEPNGVCEEYAFFYVLTKLAERFDDKINDALVLSGTKLLASYGYTTGQEGRATGPGIEAMRRIAASGKLDIDLVSYPDILAVDDIQPAMTYTNRFRVGGVKLTIDGSPQGKTAWLSKPYHVPPPGQDKDYKGYAAVNQQTVDQSIEKAFAHGWQILVHANGDAAINSMISAVRAARQKHPDVQNRPVLIHGQTLRQDQVGSLKELEIFPSLFPMHTFYWGDWHRDSVLGPERAENISPTGWVLEQDMRFSTHHDAPVALPDSMRVLSATVTRTTRSGAVLGPEHRVPVNTALKAMTLWPAWQHFEEKTKGSIEVGKLADFAILSDNPLTIAREKLAEIKVLETIKEDRSIYKHSQKDTMLSSPALFGVTLNESDYVMRDQMQSSHKHIHGDGCFNDGLDLLYRAINN
ncbi:MAG: amidohydrolase family protein [Gammaproteobacteria bacterium]|jgi:hypothetical protein